MIEGLTEEQQRYAARRIKDTLREVLPAIVLVRFGVASDPELGDHATIDVFWPKYVLSWMGRPEGHVLKAQELVRISFNRNVFTRAIGALVAPYVQNYISANPITLLPHTEVQYPEGRMRLRVMLDEGEAETDEFLVYFTGLVDRWASELRSTVLKERGAQEN